MTYKIFISYSTRDLDKVDTVRGMLQQAETEVFVAEYSVEPGAQLQSEIHRAIQECDLFILLWSSHASESAWVTTEVAKAQATGKQILPVLLEEGVQLPIFLSGFKYLSAHAHPEKATKWLQQNVYDRAKRHQQAQGFAWLALGAALIWLSSE